MLCDKCGKNNATVYIKQIINNKETTQHLCEQCASEIMDIGNFSLDKFFNDFGDFGKTYFGQTSAAPFLGSDFADLNSNVLKCPVCGRTYNDFRRSGKLGCSECYATFGDRVLPVIKSIHGKNQHVGKVKNVSCSDCGSASYKPQTKEDEDKFYEKLALQKQLQELIKSENFEEAAKVRDQIKAIENGGSDQADNKDNQKDNQE